MTTIELEQVIQDYFQDIYKKKYTGKLSILKLNPVGYCIKLGLDRPYQPIVIYAELDDELFLKFLKLELRDRRFNMIYYGELNLTHNYYPNTLCND